MLGHRVWAECWPGHHASDRRHDDDASAAFGNHVLEDGLSDRECAEHVHFEEMANTVDRYVGHWAGLACASIVDEHIDIPRGNLGHIVGGDVELLDGELWRLGTKRLGLRLGLGSGDHMMPKGSKCNAGVFAES